MSNENDMIVAGIIGAFVGLLLLISPQLDNLVTLYTGQKGDTLLLISLVFLCGGVSVALVAAYTKPS